MEYSAIPNAKKYPFFSQLLTKNSQLESFEKWKLKIQYKHENLHSFFAVKAKNRVIECFWINTVYFNIILLCFMYFLYDSSFPNFKSLRTNFPNSEGPAPILKILKKEHWIWFCIVRSDLSVQILRTLCVTPVQQINLRRWTAWSCWVLGPDSSITK